MSVLQQITEDFFIEGVLSEETLAAHRETFPGLVYLATDNGADLG